MKTHIKINPAAGWVDISHLTLQEARRRLATEVAGLARLLNRDDSPEQSRGTPMPAGQLAAISQTIISKSWVSQAKR